MSKKIGQDHPDTGDGAAGLTRLRIGIMAHLEVEMPEPVPGHIWPPLIRAGPREMMRAARIEGINKVMLYKVNS